MQASTVPMFMCLQRDDHGSHRERKFLLYLSVPSCTKKRRNDSFHVAQSKDFHVKITQTHSDLVYALLFRNLSTISSRNVFPERTL